MELQTTNYCWTGGLWAVLVVNTEDVFSKGIVRNDETKPEGGGTMLARINKHIPKASELQMVTLTLFLITNTISCPAWDSMQITVR